MKKSIFVGPLVSCARRFAFTLGFLVIKLTRTDNAILLQMPVSNSISDTGESWSTDSPAKQKTMRNAIQILLLKRTPKISFQPMKNRTPSYITLNCHIFSLPFIVLGVCPKLYISTTLLQGFPLLQLLVSRLKIFEFTWLVFFKLSFCSLVLLNIWLKRLSVRHMRKKWRVNSKHLHTPGCTAC